MNRAIKWIGAVSVIGISLSIQASALGAEASARERLSISVTNKYGDVFTNLVVSKILSDGLVLEHKSGELKVKYAELPSEVREKYQPLAAAAEQKDRQVAEQNAAFVAEQRKAQAEQLRARAVKDKGPLMQSPQYRGRLKIAIPNQGWAVTFLDPGLKGMGKQTSTTQFVYEGLTQNGFNLSLFVEQPAGSGADHKDVFNFYWPQASRNPLIDEKSVKTEMKDNFVRVSYTTLGIPNVNYYFACKGRWVDLHISKSPFTREDARLFSDFEANLSYGDL